jgi:hypothetical protein
MESGGFGQTLSRERGAAAPSHLAPLDLPSSVGFADIFSRKGRRVGVIIVHSSKRQRAKRKTIAANRV